MSAADDDIDRLYSGSLHGFVAARKALAKKLKDAGQQKDADAIAELAKPSLAAWALNRLVHGQRPLLTRFLNAIDRERDLQLAALSGGADAAALRQAKGQEAGAMAAILARLPDVLQADGHTTNKATTDRVKSALRAAALSAEQRPLLERGRLCDEPESAGFDAIAAQLDPALLMSALQAPARSEEPRKPVDALFARAARRQADVAGAPEERPSTPAKRAAEAARNEKRAQQERDKLERRTRAKSTVAETRAELEVLRTQGEGLEARVRQLGEALEAAKHDAKQTTRRISQLKERLAKAEKRVRILED